MLNPKPFLVWNVGQEMPAVAPGLMNIRVWIKHVLGPTYGL